MEPNFTLEYVNDSKIVKCQYQAFYPSESSLAPGQDVHIVVQNPQIIVLPNQDYMQIKFKRTPEATKPFTDCTEVYKGPSTFFLIFDIIQMAQNLTDARSQDYQL